MDNIIDDKPMTIWEKTAEEELYSMLLEMGYRKESIDKVQRKRIFETIIVFIVFLTLGFVVNNFFFILAFIGTFYLYRSKFKHVLGNYQVWKFNRHLQFNKFTRLLIPYLLQAKGDVALYSIFNKILLRIINEVDRNSLYLLMSEMSSKPSDVNPFIDFANRSSGTDMSVLFMSTIFDFQQSTFDIEVINELGKLSSQELLSSIDDIIQMKLNRFNNFATKITMASFILFIGYATVIIVDIISGISI